MNWASPSAFLWAIPAVAVLVALYLLKLRRKPLVVPAIFLWPKHTEEIRANSLFQKPKFNILFWLQLLALLAIIAALAAPQALSRSLTGKVTMIVIDGSASMGATDVSPSRLESARRLAKQAISETRPGDRFGIILAGQQPRVILPLSDQPDLHVAKLDEFEAEDIVCDMGEALRLAAASLNAFEGARILVLSDGAFRPVTDFAFPNGQVTFRPIGSSAKNVGISALGSTSSARGRELYCAVRNSGLDAANAEFTLEVDGKPVDARNIRIKANGTWATTVVVPEDAKFCQAAIDVDDHLKADNRRFAVLSEGGQLRVLLVGPGDYFLERALALDPRVTLESSRSIPDSELASSSSPSKYDLIVFAGTPEVAVKARGVLAFGAPSEASPVRSSGSMSKPQYLSRADDPVVRDIEFSEVYVETASKTKPIGTARTLMEATGGPLIVARENAGRRQLYVAFELTKSDWPLHVGFPIFIGQAISYLSGERRLDVATQPAGKSFTIPLKLGEKFQAPDGVRASKQENYAVVRGLPRVGEYKFTVGDAMQRFFANLEDPEEPKIEPAAFVQLGANKVGVTAIPQRPIDLWRWVVLLGLAVLTLEWWVFFRKS